MQRRSFLACISAALFASGLKISSVDQKLFENNKNGYLKLGDGLVVVWGQKNDRACIRLDHYMLELTDEEDGDWFIVAQVPA